MNTTVTSKVDPRLLVILGIFSAVFGSIGVWCAFRQAVGWEVLLGIVGLLSVCCAEL
jgi:hypothetical protein